jgi:pSer/pThr/pTyr-binding forkhead associated (FHA) protein
MAPVIVKLGDDPRVIPLPAEPVTVGRSSQNGIAIMDASLSRVHCELRRVDGGVVVRDLGSRNGTLVNGQTVREHRLAGGDRVEVGICRIVVHLEGGQIKLEVSAGKGTSSSSGDTARIRNEQADTAQKITMPTLSYSGDAVAWGRRSGGGGKAAAILLVVGAIAAAGLGIVLKNRRKHGPATVVDPWRTMDYADPSKAGSDWEAVASTPTRIALAAGREGNGLEVSRPPGERGLAEAALTRTMDVEAGKAYRFSAWCRTAGGHAGLRLGWLAQGGEVPFAHSGAGLAAGEGERGGTWLAPAGAVEARLLLVVAGEGASAVFDDVDFADATLPDKPPVEGRTVQAAFEAPGVLFLAARGGDPIRAVVGFDTSDATCAIGAKKTAKGGSFELPDPVGGVPAMVVEERDAEGEGFVMRWASKASGLSLALATDALEVDGRPVSDPIRTARALVGRPGARIVLELRPDAEVAVVGGRAHLRFPGESFEVAFLPEAGGGRVAGELAEASKAEAQKEYGKALVLYEAAIEKNPKGDAAQAAEERLTALRALAEDALKRARFRRADAELTGRPQGCDDAMVEYMMLEKEFDGTEYAAQARAEREATTALRTQLATELADSEVGRLLVLAETYLNEDRLMLARVFCEAAQDRATDPDVAARIDALLQRVAGKEAGR